MLGNIQYSLKWFKLDENTFGSLSNLTHSLKVAQYIYCDRIVNAWRESEFS